jgi:hypothetical protein
LLDEFMATRLDGCFANQIVHKSGRVPAKNHSANLRKIKAVARRTKIACGIGSEK